MEGSSGPTSQARIRYGTRKQTDAIRQYFHARKPSIQDLFLPKKRVMKPSMKMGRMMPMGRCMRVTYSPMVL